MLSFENIELIGKKPRQNKMHDSNYENYLDEYLKEIEKVDMRLGQGGSASLLNGYRVSIKVD